MEKKDSLQRRSETVIAKIDCVLRKEPQKLTVMNKRKEGRPFLYSDDLIMAISFFRFYFCPKLRQTEALVRRIYGYSPDHTTIDRRLSTIKPQWTITKSERKGRLLAIDATGISVSNRRGYRDSRYGPEPKFYKLHAVVDVEEMEIVDFRLTSEHVADNRKFLAVVREAARRGDTIYADGAYDAKENFSFLEKKGIRSGIKIRQTASPTAPGCLPRKKAVMEQFSFLPHSHLEKTHPLAEKGMVFLNEKERMKYWQQKWKEKVGYGRRWLVESFFSAFSGGSGSAYAPEGGSPCRTSSSRRRCFTID